MTQEPRERATPEAVAPRRVTIRGARTHNLKGVDVDLPRDQLVVITGPSGSGKSSLAFDTIFAEGQRRYVESLSAGARQFLSQLPKPDVDLIEGLSPAIAISQVSGGRNPRSTVGTATEVYDYLRLLYARVGEVYSHRSGQRMRKHTVEDMLEEIFDLTPGTRFSILAPVARGAAGAHAELLDALRRQGFVRVAIDDEVHDLGETISLDPRGRHDIDVYVDRLKLKDGVRGRVADSLEVALRLADGRAHVLTTDGRELRFCERYTDFEHAIAYPELTPALFSFNSPDGACPRCDGLGCARVFDPDKLVPDPNLSVQEGALAPWVRGSGDRTYAKPLQRQLAAVAEHLGCDLYAPWRALPAEARVILLQGSGDEAIPSVGKGKRGAPFEGLIPWLERRLREAEQRADEDEDDGEDDQAGRALESITAYMTTIPCRECAGQRLRLEARMVRLGGDGETPGKNISELAALPVQDALAYLEALLAGLEPEREEIAEAILEKACQRLRFMVDLGLGYLTLDRATMTLSGGEAQRIRLATQIGAALVGVTYILDEPSVGLHQRDNDRLLAALRRLRDLGNTVLVVEHDEDTIRAADYVVDMGPGAGVLGGEVVAAGTLAQVLEDRNSMTAAFLSGRAVIPTPRSTRPKPRHHLRIEGARGHNLQRLDVEIPLGALTCVTGVSGSGKSSLVVDTLLAEARRRLQRAQTEPLPHTAIKGLEQLDKVIYVDQSPIGRSPRSNPATYTGVFGELRNLYAQLPEAKIRGFKASRFSFNVKGGRCEACKGEGVRRIAMHFLPDMFVTCRTCDGRRYNRDTLAITYRGQSIADVLESSVADACGFFAAHPALRRGLETLRDVGLGYLTLGQSATTLSGGEAQRIKLARELARKATRATLFVLDEPTTGLHFVDVRKLLEVLERLVDEGNTVVVIEHNLDVIKCADHIIDLGPEGGDGGGALVAVGTPRQVARVEASHTGRYLKRALARAR
ncbi:MAG: excinuclease ABC subunit UvrA [Myxococcales bacterium]|nr:excinuclease ABC subunit UvrA [Myxococcales bacterium]